MMAHRWLCSEIHGCIHAVRICHHSLYYTHTHIPTTRMSNRLLIPVLLSTQSICRGMCHQPVQVLGQVILV